MCVDLLYFKINVSYRFFFSLKTNMNFIEVSAFQKKSLCLHVLPHSNGNHVTAAIRITFLFLRPHFG